MLAIISYDGTDNDHDALALGRVFGDAGAQVALAYVRHAPEDDPVAEAAAQEQAEELLARGAAWLGHPEVGRHVVMSPGTGAGLRALAESLGADVVVLGSDAHTAPGHVQPGRSALRLLDGGPVAVALAPARLRERDERLSLERIAVAGGEIDPAARETAATLASELDAQAVLPSDPALDLLVVGSRPGTPPGCVGLSSASEYLLETAHCPVLVVPRGVRLGVVERVAR